MDSIETIKAEAPTFLTKALSIRVTNDITKDFAVGVLVKSRVLTKRIGQLGVEPIKNAKVNLEKTKLYFKSLAQPFDQSSAHLDKEITAYWVREKAAQAALQKEEITRFEQSGGNLAIVPAQQKSVVTDDGMGTVSEIKTYDFRNIIIDGKVVKGTDLLRSNHALAILPDHLFVLNVPALRKFALAGATVEGLRVYVKPSIRVRE